MTVHDGRSLGDVFPLAKIDVIGRKAVLYRYERIDQSWEQYDRLLDATMTTLSGDRVKFSGRSEHLATVVRTEDCDAEWIVELKGCQDCG